MRLQIRFIYSHKYICIQGCEPLKSKFGKIKLKNQTNSTCFGEAVIEWAMIVRDVLVKKGPGASLFVKPSLQLEGATNLD